MTCTCHHTPSAAIPSICPPYTFARLQNPLLSTKCNAWRVTSHTSRVTHRTSHAPLSATLNASTSSRIGSYGYAAWMPLPSPFTSYVSHVTFEPSSHRLVVGLVSGDLIRWLLLAHHLIHSQASLQNPQITNRKPNTSSCKPQTLYRTHFKLQTSNPLLQEPCSWEHDESSVDVS